MLIDDDEIDRRLANWVRCYGSGSPSLGYGSPMADLCDSVNDPRRFKQCTIPLWDTEARQTDDDIEALEVGRRLTLKEHHLGRGVLSEKLRRLGIKQATYYDRIKKARVDLQAVWQERDRALRTMRESAEFHRAQKRGTFTE